MVELHHPEGAGDVGILARILALVLGGFVIEFCGVDWVVRVGSYCM